MKFKIENCRINEKLRMNENVEGCKTIYSHKTFLDCNYGQMKRFKFIKYNTKQGEPFL